MDGKRPVKTALARFGPDQRRRDGCALVQREDWPEVGVSNTLAKNIKQTRLTHLEELYSPA
jgi:hypothetical protein